MRGYATRYGGATDATGTCWSDSVSSSRDLLHDACHMLTCDEVVARFSQLTAGTWARDLVPIADTSTGDMFCYVVGSNPPSIVYVDHETERANRRDALPFAEWRVQVVRDSEPEGFSDLRNGCLKEVTNRWVGPNRARVP